MPIIGSYNVSASPPSPAVGVVMGLFEVKGSVLLLPRKTGYFFYFVDRHFFFLCSHKGFCALEAAILADLVGHFLLVECPLVTGGRIFLPIALVHAYF